MPGNDHSRVKYSEGDTCVVKCSCGWSTERPDKKAAEKAYNQHVKK
jgi:hypothetical protein